MLNRHNCTVLKTKGAGKFVVPMYLPPTRHEVGLIYSILEKYKFSCKNIYTFPDSVFAFCVVPVFNSSTKKKLHQRVHERHTTLFLPLPLLYEGQELDGGSKGRGR